MGQLTWFDVPAKSTDIEDPLIVTVHSILSGRSTPSISKPSEYAPSGKALIAALMLCSDRMMISLATSERSVIFSSFRATNLLAKQKLHKRYVFTKSPQNVQKITQIILCASLNVLADTHGQFWRQSIRSIHGWNDRSILLSEMRMAWTSGGCGYT